MTTGKATVFVVDDDISVRRSLKRLLASAGYEARVFESGEELLAVTEWPPRCCLVVDVSMPGMTGLDVLDAVRQSERQTPVILISGYADDLTIARARSMGAAAFLAKPCSAAELLTQVEQVLRERITIGS